MIDPHSAVHAVQLSLLESLKVSCSSPHIRPRYLRDRRKPFALGRRLNPRESRFKVGACDKQPSQQGCTAAMNMALALVLFSLGFVVASTKSHSPACRTGIAHSNRTANAPCSGALGDQCNFVCDLGWIQVGSRLVCQCYTTKSGDEVLDHQFWGARCERACKGE
jgi:hypothetical protein